MENKDILKENDVVNMTRQEATVFAASLIADAMDRQTNLQKKSLEIQMQMTGIAGEMFESMKNSLNQLDDGDEWKRDDEDDDGLH